jgi:hypothetical protein
MVKNIINIKYLFVLILFFFIGSVYGKLQYPKPDKEIVMKKVCLPVQIVAYKQFIYIVDRKRCPDTKGRIHILETGEYIGSFGEQGEGSRELRVLNQSHNPVIFIHSDKITVNSQSRVSFFNLDGSYINEKQIKSPKDQYSIFVPCKNNFLAITAFEGKRERYDDDETQLFLYDSNFKRISAKPLVSTSGLSGGHEPITAYNFVFSFPPTTLAYQVTEDGKIFITYQKEDSSAAISVFDADGNSIKTIDLNSVIPARIKVTEKYKNDITEHFELEYGKERYEKMQMYKCPDKKLFPPVKNMIIDEDKIYLITYNKNEKGKTRCIILDTDGRKIGDIFLPIAKQQLFSMLYTIKNGMLYTLYEDEEEEKWKLLIYDIEKIKEKSIPQMIKNSNLKLPYKFENPFADYR